MLRRRRRQRLDRDVAAAAAAAAATQHSRSAFDDDEETGMAQYGGYYASTTPGVDVMSQPQQPPMGGYQDYEDPAGGYDHYATEMNANRDSTANGAGMAGYGAQAAEPSYVIGNDDPYYHPNQEDYNYAEEDPYGGYGEPQPSHRRTGSEGSVAREAEERGLRVANY